LDFFDLESRCTETRIYKKKIGSLIWSGEIQTQKVYVATYLKGAVAVNYSQVL